MKSLKETIQESILDQDFNGPEIISKEVVKALTQVKKIIGRAETGRAGVKLFYDDDQDAVNDIYDALKPVLEKLPKNKVDQASAEGKTIVVFDERSWLGMEVWACTPGEFNFEYASLMGFEGTAMMFSYNGKCNKHTTYYAPTHSGLGWYTIEDSGVLIKLFKEAAGR